MKQAVVRLSCIVDDVDLEDLIQSSNFGPRQPIAGVQPNPSSEGKASRLL